MTRGGSEHAGLTTDSGLDTVRMMPVGATLVGKWYCSPGHYTPEHGGRHDDFGDALREAVADYRERNEAHRAATLSMYGEAWVRDLPSTITVDLRAKFSYPEGGGVETVAHRVIFDSIEDAEKRVAHLDRLAARR